MTAISGWTAASAAARAQEIPCNDGGTTKKVTVAQLVDMMGRKKAVLTGDAASNSTTTAAKISSLDTADDGTGYYNFVYTIRYQAGATTTGVKFSVNHTGTLSYFVANMRYVSTGTTATTGAASQAANGAAGNIMEGLSARAKSTAAGMGPTVSVDAANSDMLCIIEGTCKVTGTGNFELYHASEVAAATTVKEGSNLVLEKVG